MFLTSMVHPGVFFGWGMKMARINPEKSGNIGDEICPA
jgi:hypothetical protein